MEMSSTQRLILANQYKLMGLLDPNNAAKISNVWKPSSKVALRWNYANWTASFLPFRKKKCRTVLNTLEMYKALQISYNNLEDKSDLSEHRLQFVGYCAVREKKISQLSSLYHRRGRTISRIHALRTRL